MPRLTAVHRTTLHYRGMVAEQVNEAWLTPLDGPRQRVDHAEIRVTPSGELVTHHDAFGNVVTWFQLVAPHEHLMVEARALVEVTLPAPVEEPGWAAVLDPRHADLMADFLTVSPHVRWTPPVAALGEEIALPSRDEAGVAAWLAVLERRLNEKIKYSPGATGVETPVEEVVHARRGVCQDLAHLAIALCRHEGVPARYVSGWLHEPGASGPGESHAWAEAHLGPAGWVEIDPTHPGMRHERYIRVAVGRDYSDVPPLRGSYVGAGTDSMTVEVFVREPGAASD